MTRVRGPERRTKRQTVVSDSEFLEAMNRAERIKDVFLRLRALAVLCLLRLTGKRRGEVAILPLSNFKVEGSFLNITFILPKKRKETVLSKTAKKNIPVGDSLADRSIKALVLLECSNSESDPDQSIVFLQIQ